MAGFNWGSFAGGVGQGIEQGQNIRAQWDTRAARQLAKQADANYSTWLEKNSPIPGVGAAGAPPAPQGPAPPPVNAMPTPPVPGAGGPPTGPMTSMQGPMAPQINGPSGLVPSAPMPGATGAGPQPMPMPGAQPMPGAPSAPPPSPTPTPPTGGGQPPGPFDGGDPTQDVVKQSQNAIQSIAAQILQGFPGKRWKPGELLATVDSVLGHMEKVDPIAKQMAQLQIKYYDERLKALHYGDETGHWGAQDTIAQDRLAEQKLKDQQAHEDRMNSVRASLARGKMSADARVQAAGIAAGARITAESMVQGGDNERLQAALDFKSALAGAELDEKEGAAALAAEVRMRGLDDSFIAKIFGAAPQTDKSGAPALVKAPMREPLPGFKGTRPQAPNVGGVQGRSNVSAGSQRNPYKPKSRQEAEQLPSGSFFVDPTGAVIQKH